MFCTQKKIRENFGGFVDQIFDQYQYQYQYQYQNQNQNQNQYQNQVFARFC